MQEIKFYLEKAGKAPKKALNSDACWDLYACSKENIEGTIHYDTGVRFQIPEGWVGLVFPRSSISKTHLTLTNCVGVIDSGYIGTIKLRFKVLKNKLLEEAHISTYSVGDRVCQIMFLKLPEVNLVESKKMFEETIRSEGSFGSTGN